ncbi:MAG: FAD-dependent oxidoreductase [Rhodoferax sp.]|nr:FAD-dependent oxidoreductase [Rhodoferax sp.]
MKLSRRTLLQAASASLVASPLLSQAQSGQSIVIIGAGFGGATAAKYLKRFNPALKVTLIEPNAEFIMCPMSNRVVYGGMTLRDITRPYERFMAKHDIRWIRGSADEIDPDKREVRVGKDRVAYDRLIVSPGVDYNYEGIGGMGSARAQALVPHAWKAGEQTQRLRDMLYAMPQGGVVAMHIPKVPYRCPPGPYERASLIAYFLQLRNPTGKLLVFDSNPEIQAKKGLFEAAWKNKYAGLLEYVPNAEVQSVDAATQTIDLMVQGKQKVDVLNLIPPQRASGIARRAGLANVGERWCGVDFLTYESTRHKGIHVLGDSIAGAPGMPKSGHMANQEAKVCAGAIAALSLGQPVPDLPIIANTCYSFVSQSDVIHVASVHRYDAAKKTMVVVPGAGGLSPAPSASEGLFAMAWATNIMNDTLG